MTIFYTGDIPTEAMIPNRNTLSGHLKYSEVATMFAGCIDAPDYIPAGSHRSVKVDGDTYPTPSSVSRASSL